MTERDREPRMPRLRDEVLRAQLRPVLALALAAALLAALGLLTQYLSLRWSDANPVDDIQPQQLLPVLAEAQPGQWPQLARWLVQYGLEQPLDGPAHVLLNQQDRVPVHVLVQLVRAGQRIDPISQSPLGPAPPAWLEPLSPGQWRPIDGRPIPVGDGWRGLVLALNEQQRLVLQAPAFALPIHDLLRTTALLFAVIFVLAGVFVAVFFWLFRQRYAASSGARLAGPIERLAEALQRFMADQRHPVDVPIEPPLEVAQLARSANLLQRQLSASLRELEQTNADQRRFMAEISHELRTPLTVIRGHAERLKRAADPKENSNTDINKSSSSNADSADLILRQVDDLHRLLSDLIDLERMASICAGLHMEPVSVKAVLEEMHARFKAPAWRQGVLLVLEPTPDDWRVSADARWLRQVLANVLTNAIRHTPPGGWVSLSAAQKAEKLLIVVDDTGTGLGGPAPNAEAEERNAGIGLRLVRKLLSGMGGDLQAQGNADGGTRMVLELNL